MPTMQLAEFAVSNQDDALFLRVGERVIRLTLTQGDEGPSPTPHLQGLGFDGGPEEMKQFVMLVCSRIVGGLLPDEVRAKLTKAAEAL